MQCRLSKPAVHTLARIIHCLSKVGEDLYFEAHLEELVVRSMNNSRSAFGRFRLNLGFFEEYTLDEPDNSYAIKCKVNMRSCLHAFRSLSLIERTVEGCLMTIDSSECVVSFRMLCTQSIARCYILPFNESDSLVVNFNRNNCANCFVASPAVLADCFAKFPTKLDEITLTFTETSMSARSAIDDSVDLNQLLQTELKLDAAEFTRFSIAKNTEITFCLRELRAIIAFCEAGNYLPLEFGSDAPGKPIIVTVDQEASYIAHIVLATLANSSTSGVTQDTDPSSSNACSAAQNHQNQQHQQQQQHFSPQGGQLSRADDDDDDDYAADAAIMAIDNDLSQGVLPQHSPLTPHTPQQKSTTITLDSPLRRPLRDSPQLPSSDAPMPTIGSSGAVAPVCPPTPGTPRLLQALRSTGGEGFRDDDESDDSNGDGEPNEHSDNDDYVAATPPRKKYKSIFSKGGNFDDGDDDEEDDDDQDTTDM